jgi:hypothetical protein
MQFMCSCCGLVHDASDISFGANSPLQWDLLSEEERATSELGSDQCVIDTGAERHFFVRACLEIPIRGSHRPFSWGVWVSLSEKSFLEMSEHWEDPDRSRLGPYFGWLCTKVPEYPDTMFLKTRVHERAPGLRPTVELEKSDHPLAIDQREGIEPKRLREIVTRLLHPEES